MYGFVISPTSSNPISKRHSTAPLTGRSLVENVGFPMRIDLYLSSFGFLHKTHAYEHKQIKLRVANALSNSIYRTVRYINSMLTSESLQDKV